MAGRFDIDNFLSGGQKGFLKVLENIFLSPTYTFASFFPQAKLKYIFILFLTQAFLPILQKEWVNYLLLIPLVVINLLSNWLYQVDFGFQYSYGTNVLVLFMSLLALEAIWQSTQAKEIFKLCKDDGQLGALGLIKSLLQEEVETDTDNINKGIFLNHQGQKYNKS